MALASDSDGGSDREEKKTRDLARPATKTGQVCRDKEGRWVVDFRTPGNFASLAAHLVTVFVATGVEFILGPVTFTPTNGGAGGEYDAFTWLKHSKDKDKKDLKKPYRAPQVNMPSRHLPNLLSALRHMWDERAKAKKKQLSIAQLLEKTLSDADTEFNFTHPTDHLPTTPCVLDSQFEIQVVEVDSKEQPGTTFHVVEFRKRRREGDPLRDDPKKGVFTVSAPVPSFSSVLRTVHYFCALRNCIEAEEE